jgi:hypothetical protein
MKDNCKKVIGITAKIMKRIFNVFFVIVVIYYGVTAIFDLSIYPILTGKFPKLFQDIRYVFDRNKAKIDEGDPVKMTAEAVSVSIQNIANTFRENSIEVQKTYHGKILRLTGTVSRIGTDTSYDGVKTYYVDLVDDPDRPYYNQVQVYPRKDEVHKLDGLIIGQTVTIVGKYTDVGWRVSVQIKDAFFE